MANILWPTLLVCGMFAIIISIGIAGSYFWLSWLNAEMTKCPQCGRRGGGELAESTVINSRAYTEWLEGRNMFGRTASQRRQVRVTEKTYEDQFLCKHCGHQWIKTAQEKKHSPV